LAIISKEDPNKIVAARFSSPLLIGLGENEYIVASDPSAVIAHTKKVIYLDDGEVVTITPENFFMSKEKQPEQIEWSLEDAQKSGYPHFMLKEIMEQPESIQNSLRGRLLFEEGKAKLGGLNPVRGKLNEIERINISGFRFRISLQKTGFKQKNSCLSYIPIRRDRRYARSVKGSQGKRFNDAGYS
jgi:glucosamine--fructose-6-phosphate aminotransferase (isomerizing)